MKVHAAVMQTFADFFTRIFVNETQRKLLTFAIPNNKVLEKLAIIFGCFEFLVVH